MIACLLLGACGDTDTASSVPGPQASTAAGSVPEAQANSAAPVGAAPAVTESGRAPAAQPASASSQAEPSVAATGMQVAAAEGGAEAASPPVDGGMVYNQVCAVCHRTGLNAAPKYGDKLKWKKVVEKGRDAVYQNALNGIRGMPPRGGVATLTDEEIKAATDYMVNGSGGWGG
jgi:cytochrome c5